MTKKTIKASAPGKIHFIGEHTAVYFKPAILAAINKRCFVELTPTDSPEFVLTSKNFNKTITLSLDDILRIRDSAQEQWETYREHNDIALLKKIVPDEITYPVIAIGETIRHFKKNPTGGFHMTIDSHIPIGSGHGSSAAVAASVVGAVTQFLNETTDRNVIGRIAIRVEQKKHGNPSFGDVGTVVNGGLIWFQKKSPEDVLIKPLEFSVPKAISDNLLLIQSGIPEESTGEMVHAAAEFKKQNEKIFTHILEYQELLTEALSEAIKLEDTDSFIEIVKTAEKNLETIGVVSDAAKSLIREIEKNGGAAKICGAGGRMKGSGIILAYHTDKTVIKSLAKKQNLAYYTVQLGGEGLTIT